MSTEERKPFWKGLLAAKKSSCCNVVIEEIRDEQVSPAAKKPSCCNIVIEEIKEEAQTNHSGKKSPD